MESKKSLFIKSLLTVCLLVILALFLHPETNDAIFSICDSTGIGEIGILLAVGIFDLILVCLFCLWLPSRGALKTKRFYILLFILLFPSYSLLKISLHLAPFFYPYGGLSILTLLACGGAVFYFIFHGLKRERAALFVFFACLAIIWGTLYSAFWFQLRSRQQSVAHSIWADTLTAQPCSLGCDGRTEGIL